MQIVEPVLAFFVIAVVIVVLVVVVAVVANSYITLFLKPRGQKDFFQLKPKIFRGPL